MSYNIQVFYFSHILILKTACFVFHPYFPPIYLIDLSFHFEAGLCLPSWTVLPSNTKAQQTLSRQLNCHFHFVSESESSKAWISNSDGAATNQTVIVTLLQGKLVRLGYVARSASLAFSSQKWFRGGVDDIVESQNFKGLVQVFIPVPNDWMAWEVM